MESIMVEHSPLDTPFAQHVRAGERVRCCVVTGPGGFGKTHIAEGLAQELVEAGVLCALVHGDLVSKDTEFDDVQVVIVDAADQAPPDFLLQLRAEAMAPSSTRSLLLLARSAAAQPELAELAALADRDDRVLGLAPTSLDELAARTPPTSSITADLLADLTGSIPIHVDRLCGSWDDVGWPDADDDVRAHIHERFTKHVEIQAGRLTPETRIVLGARSLTGSPVVDTDERTHVAILVDAGLAEPDGRIPGAVALAVPRILTDQERERAVHMAGIGLLQTDVGGAVDVVDGLSTPPSWAAIAWAAAGRYKSASDMLDQVRDEPDGALLAAGAHVAAAEARWADAARFSAAVDEHPYWSRDKTAAVARLYAVLDGQTGSSEDESRSDEPSARFLHEAVDALAATLAEQAPEGLGERLRSLARQTLNQQPMLDIAVSGSELAAIAALLSGDFEVARSLIEQSPESADRSPLTESFERWVSLRTGAPSAEDGSGEVGGVDDSSEVLAPRVLALAARVMESRRTGDIQGQREVLDEIVSIGSMLSVDVLTFDALCELYLGAQRVDARREARELGRGLDAFVERVGSPMLWDARRAWNKVEAAIAGGDADAVKESADALAAVRGIDVVLSPLVAASRQWVRVFNGQIDKTSLNQVLDDLEDHGFVWEAAALAGQAAIRTSNSDMARELLQRGREFRQAAPEAKVMSPAGLSEREIEVGLLVLAGHSYKEIGATCFISPKTVEHHIAHIRQKLVAVGVSRAEFRAALEADLRPLA